MIIFKIVLIAGFVLFVLGVALFLYEVHEAPIILNYDL